MPNWCVGNIRFRGKINDIMRLLQENVVVCRYSDEQDENDFHKIEKYESIVDPAVGDDGVIEEITISTDKDKSWFYIKGTNRNFISMMASRIDITDVYEMNDGDYIVILDDFQAAWSIEAEPYVEMSKKYMVDIHIFGWERGVEFDQEIEIIRGNLTKNFGHGGKNWLWETAMPYFGG